MPPRFIYNLRVDTYDPEVVTALNPAGYLLAPNNATRSLVKLAKALDRQVHAFYADNGNFTLIGDVRQLFSDKGDRLWGQVQALEKQLGRSLRAADVPPALRAEYRALATAARDRAEVLVGDGESMLAEQLALDPTVLIGVEDLTMAVWLSLDIEPDYTKYPRRLYRTINARVARAAVRRLAALPAHLVHSYYPVASAVSYNTAYDAGREFGAAGIERVAMGFGAYMADGNYVDHLYVGRRRVDIGARVPTRYLRTALAARGFWDGYKVEATHPPVGFHFLGMGAPIMMAIVALCAWGTDDLSFDAMSPIKDAVEGTLYVSRPAYLKIRTRSSAFRLASQDGERWACPCPFCRKFAAAHPFRYDVGRAWFDATAATLVKAEDLRPGGALFDAYPLLGEPRTQPLRSEVTFARLAHNHWALEQVITELGAASTSYADLKAHVQDLVNRYADKTSSANNAQAIRVGLGLAAGDLP